MNGPPNPQNTSLRTTTVIASTIYYSHTYNLPITYMKYLGDIDTLTQWPWLTLRDSDVVVVIGWVYRERDRAVGHDATATDDDK